MGHTILITGASGFLGSALCVDLSRDHKIIGLYRRPLSERLKKATPLVQWEKSLAGGEIAYPKSKALGEKMLFKNSYKVPVAVLRLGGGFTDWYELPPLFSVMKM